MHFLVVDNNSGDGSAEELRSSVSSYPNVELLESTSNRGYFGGANWALQNYLRRRHRPDWVVVSNHDITFNDPKFFTRLLQRDPASAAVLAPTIISSQTGIDSNPFLRRRPSEWQLRWYRFWLSHYSLMWCKQLLSPFVRRLRQAGRRPSEHGDCSHIYAPHGSFLIFSRSYFEAGGCIDDGFFLYAEEFSVAEICRRLGLQIVHERSLRVFHDAHHATGRLCNRAMFDEGRKGLEYALRNYFFPRPGVEFHPSQRNDAAASLQGGSRP